MVPWGTGIPDWTRLAGEGLDLPGIQAVLLSRGSSEMEHSGVEGLNWECCGLYMVRVNGGGIRAEEPVPPSRSVTAPLNWLDPWRCPLDVPGDRVEGVIVNPLGWRPLTPRLGVQGTSCIEAGGIKVGLLHLEPLGMGSPSKCITARPEGRVDSFRMGHHRVWHDGRIWSHGTVSIIVGPSGIVAGSRGSLISEPGGGLAVDLGFYDYDVYILYPLHYRLLDRVRRGDRIEVEALSIHLKGPGGGLGLSSPWGLKATLYPGRVEVEAKNLALITGSESLAYRALLEQVVSWRPVKAPSGGLGHLRPGPGAPLLLDSCGNELVFLVQNPSLRDGIFEARIRAPVSRVVVESPLGSIEVPAPGGLFRVPAPRGYVGIARVRLGRGLLVRLRKSGGPGRIIQPV
ncbi:MAG: hypothetical protein F7B18_04150 [Desulfurococcales archaeon]|nr:hypothetical protein [Desulfurococcales archaeon]